MNYDKAFDNFAKALSEGFSPDQVSTTPEPNRKIDIGSETLSVSDSLKEGTLAGYFSSKILDKKEHFPVITQTQAQSSMSRVMQLSEAPAWYNGTIAELRQDVYDGINKMHPGIELNIRIPVEVAVALSDGEISSDTSVTSIKDPSDDRKKDEVPQVARPTLTSAQVSEALDDADVRKAVAGRLMEMVDQQIAKLDSAKKVATRMLKSGLKSDEFDQLSTYLQEDILYELLSRGVVASELSEGRRQELIARMNNKKD